MTGPSTLGITWRKMILVLETPPACAASMNSLRFTEMVWPRTMRAMVSHSTAPRATKMRKMLRPKTTISMMTKNMKGSA